MSALGCVAERWTTQDLERSGVGPTWSEEERNAERLLRHSSDASLASDVGVNEECRVTGSRPAARPTYHDGSSRVVDFNLGSDASRSDTGVEPTSASIPRGGNQRISRDHVDSSTADFVAPRGRTTQGRGAPPSHSTWAQPPALAGEPSQGSSPRETVETVAQASAARAAIASAPCGRAPFPESPGMEPRMSGEESMEELLLPRRRRLPHSGRSGRSGAAARRARLAWHDRSAASRAPRTRTAPVVSWRGSHGGGRLRGVLAFLAAALRPVRFKLRHQHRGERWINRSKR